MPTSNQETRTRRPGKRARAIAELIDRERDRLAAMGVPAAARIGARARRAFAGALRRGGDPIGEALAKLEPVAAILRDAMVLAHLRGSLRAIASAAGHARGAFQLSTGTGVYEEATRFNATRLLLTVERLELLRQQYGEEAAAVLKNLQAGTNRALLTAANRVIRDGEHVREGVRRLTATFDAAGLTELRDKNGRLLNRPWAIETVMRTQTQLAYAAGRAETWADPAIQEILWGFEYVTVGDDRVRPEHVLLDGMRLPKEDPAWRTHTPPNGYNCRCTLVEVFNDDPPDDLVPVAPPIEGIVDGRVVVPGPDPGWTFNPGEVFAAIR